MILAGVTYTITLTATTVTATNYEATTYSTIVVTGNSPPTSGSCALGATDVAFGDAIEVSCFEWLDAQENYPLEFQVGYDDASVGFVQLSSPQGTGVFHVTPPLGELAIQVRIHDSFGSAATTAPIVVSVVLADDADVAELTADLGSQASLALSNGKYNMNMLRMIRIFRF